MELICMTGSVPGRIIATLSHQAKIRQLPMTIGQHPSGGWRVTLQDGSYGPRCRTATAAIMMEASESFAEIESDIREYQAA